MTRLNASMMGFPRWSADGRHIAFHAWTGNKPQIFTTEVERRVGQPGGGRAGDGVKQITDSPFGYYSPSWSANGRYLYFDQATGGDRIFRIRVDGGSPEPLFEGATAVTTIDGHKILYAKLGHLGVFARSLDGDPAANPEERLADDYKPPCADLNPVQDGFYYISWNGDGKPRTVRFYSYAQKNAINVFSLPDLPSPPDLAVSPDRRHLVYSQLSGLGTDLTLVEFH